MTRPVVPIQIAAVHIGDEAYWRKVCLSTYGKELPLSEHGGSHKQAFLETHLEERLEKLRVSASNDLSPTRTWAHSSPCSRTLPTRSSVSASHSCHRISTWACSSGISATSRAFRSHMAPNISALFLLLN